MIEQTSTSHDRLRDTGRWGYAGDYDREPLPVEESGGLGRWLPWVVLLVIAVAAVAFLMGIPT